MTKILISSNPQSLNIPAEFLIYDTRSSNEFKIKSFSGFLVKDVINALSKSLLNSKIEEACNWAIELLLSTHTEKLWDKLFVIIFKSININNPKLAFILFDRYSKYIALLKKNDNNHYLLRNCQKMRNMIGELCYLVSFSVKTKPLSYKKIKDEDFNMVLLSTKLIATSDSFIKDKLKYGDPEETKIILNEFNYSLINKKYELAVYWLSWIFDWEKKNTKKNKVYLCGYREITNIDKKYYNDLVWFIWEIIIKEATKLNQEVEKQIHSIFKLYKYNFTSSKKSKKSIYFLYAIKYFTDNYNINYIIYPNYYLYVRVISNINILFFEKNRFCVNNRKKYEQKIFEKNTKEINMKLKQKGNRNKAKELKKIAEEKMKYKINTVEQIDSLILGNKK